MTLTDGLLIGSLLSSLFLLLSQIGVAKKVSDMENAIGFLLMEAMFSSGDDREEGQ